MTSVLSYYLSVLLNTVPKYLYLVTISVFWIYNDGDFYTVAVTVNIKYITNALVLRTKYKHESTYHAAPSRGVGLRQMCLTTVSGQSGPQMSRSVELFFEN